MEWCLRVVTNADTSTISVTVGLVYMIRDSIGSINFVLTFTCLIPFVLIIISHKLQMKAIENRIFKYISMDEKLNLSQLKVQFQYSSYIILIWSFINILLSIFLHTPIKYLQIRIILYYSQIYSFLLDPIIYILILRSLPTITLLRPTNKVYFI
ncbi:unnamed protein product [Rotaria sp. Silwood2]|nr:unnamed protein product [Rotaria sp. Silwood2]